MWNAAQLECRMAKSKSFARCHAPCQPRKRRYHIGRASQAVINALNACRHLTNEQNKNIGNVLATNLLPPHRLGRGTKPEIVRCFKVLRR
jgi:hypothetical protein